MALRYLTSRAFSTKSSRQLSASDVTSTQSRYSTVVELSSVSLGCVLTVGSLVVVGQVTKDITGPAVLISILIAAAAYALLTLSYAELRSQFPRLQASLYEYLFHSVGESVAFMVAWANTMTSLLFTAAICRAISANVDMLSGQVISNFTVQYTGEVMPFNDYLDFLAFLLVLVTMLYIAVGGTVTFRCQWQFHALYSASLLILLMFIGILGAFHFDFQLWHPQKFFQSGFTGIIKGASMILPVLLTQHKVLTSCDFMWLGIKPTVLTSITLTSVTSALTLMGYAAVVSLLSSVDAWNSDATLAAAFSSAGVYWAKYLLCPIIVLLLLPWGLLYLVQSVENLVILSRDQLVASCLSAISSETGLPLLPTLLVGVLSAFTALLFSIPLLLQITCFLTLLEGLCVTCVVLALRYKTPQHIATICDNNNRSQPETTSLIESPVRVLRTVPEMYGSLPSHLVSPTHPNPTPDFPRHSDEEDVDMAVEEYRLQSATRCYQGVARATPNKQTFTYARLAVTVFIISVLSTILVLIYGLHSLQNKQGSVIVGLIVCLLLVLCSGAVLYIQPMDKILPRTFLLKSPVMPSSALVCLMVTGLLLVVMQTPEVVVAILWITLGLTSYIVHTLCQRDSNYNTLQQFSPTHTPSTGNNNMHQSDSHLMATFTLRDQGHDTDDDLISAIEDQHSVENAD